MSKVIAIQLISGQFVIGKLVEEYDKTVVINKPIFVQEMFDPQNGPRTMALPYGHPFIVNDPKEDRNLSFKKEHLILEPQPVTQELATAWNQVTSVIETPPQGIVIAK